MFYTEFRPRQFSEVIGNEVIVKAVMGSLLNKNTAHAYFFTGGRGTGKTTTARLIAKALNCKTPKVDKSAKLYEPCDTCHHCEGFNKGSFVDLIELDGASNRGIDKIRDITDTVKLSPTSGEYKIYIIDEVHMLTTEASNALLKTLEEPPKHVIFILCTTNPEKVLNTIKSRCIQYKFEIPSVASLTTKLKKICKAKNLKIADKDLEKIAITAKGAFRDAETLLEQFSLSNLDAEKFFNVDKNSTIEFLSLFLQNDIKKMILFIDDLSSSGVSIEAWVKTLLENLRAVLLVKLKVKTIDSDLASLGITAEVVNNFDVKRVVVLMNKLSSSIIEFKNAVYPTMPLELAMIELMVEEISSTVEVKTTPYTNTLNTQQPVQQVTKPVTPQQVAPSTAKVDQASKTEHNAFAKPAPKALSQEPNKTDPNKVNSYKSEAIEAANDKKNEPETLTFNTEKIVKFPYKNLLLELKESNHSVYLNLSSCIFDHFDGKSIHLLASYSFHKERVLSVKTRQIIEKVASELLGEEVRIDCRLMDADEKAKRLTDKNVVPVDDETKKPKNLEEVFDSVFGDEATENKEAKV